MSEDGLTVETTVKVTVSNFSVMCGCIAALCLIVLACGVLLWL